MKIFETKF